MRDQNIGHWIKSGILLIVFWISSVAVHAQLSGYTQRLKGHINASEVYGTSDLSNYPALLSFTATQLRHTSSAGFVENINGYDIVFTAADGSTLLSHQIEEYDPTTGEITFWVRFPTVSPTTDTEFYVYFGNSSISTDPSSTNVWDSNYKMVLHMNESSAGPTTIFDASGNGTDGSDNGTISAAGLGGSNARNFNNTSDRIVIADNGLKLK